jgi:hypothetical protein
MISLVPDMKEYLTRGNITILQNNESLIRQEGMAHRSGVTGI